LSIEEDHEKALVKITTSSWYKGNEKLQAYLQNEWLSCKPVSSLNIYIIEHDAIFTALVPCIQTKVSWRSKHQ